MKERPKESLSENVNHTYIDSGNANDAVTLESSLEVSEKTRHAIAIQPSTGTLGHSPQKNENLCSHKNLYTNVHSNCICNSWQLQSIQMPFNSCLVKQIVAYTYHGIRLSSKKDWTFDACNNLDESPGNYAEPKKSHKKVTCYTIHLYDVYESKHLQMENRSVIARSWGLQSERKEIAVIIKRQHESFLMVNT